MTPEQRQQAREACEIDDGIDFIDSFQEISLDKKDRDFTIEIEDVAVDDPYAVGHSVAVLRRNVLSALDTIDALEAEKEQWKCDWDKHGEFDLIRDFVDGKPIAPAPGSVTDRVVSMVRALEAENERLNHRDVKYEVDCPKCNGRGHAWIDDATDAQGAMAEAVGDVKPCEACSGSGKIVMLDYPAAARSIALNLNSFCDKSKPYPDMIADAARLASQEIARLNAIVSKLPKTADGVPIAPGMRLWMYDQNDKLISAIDGGEINTPTCYSTREAALEAGTEARE